MVHPDGTWEYVVGSRRGMTWRCYEDAEVRRLFRELEELEFTVAATGQRHVWFRKPHKARVASLWRSEGFRGRQPDSSRAFDMSGPAARMSAMEVEPRASTGIR